MKISRSTIYMPWQVRHTCACWCKRVRGCGYKRRLWAGSRCVCGRARVSLMGENTVKGKMDTSIVQLCTTGHMHTLPVTCWMPFPLRVLSCVFVWCDITWGTGVGCDPGEGGKTLFSGLLSEADVSPATSIPSTGQYFVSRSPASWLAPTLRLLRESIRIFQVGLSLVFNQTLSISRSWSLGSRNCVLILSSVPVLTFSWSPRLYHCADASRTPSSTPPRSSEVSLLPEKSEIEDKVVEYIL